MDLITFESKHFSNGSSKPSKEGGVLRLYSMKFCPYAERARLVLLAKNIPHEIININLQEKPDWYLELNPEGKVPALDIGSKIIIESLDVCDYLNETYPEPNLYPSDATAKARDQELIRKYNKLTAQYYGLLKNTENKPLHEYLSSLIVLLEEYDNELASRGAYFGGSEPGMIDYMIWPWAERAEVVSLELGQKFSIPEEKITNIRTWCKNMKKLDVIKKTIVSTERLFKFWEMVKAGGTIDYDSI